MREAFLFSLITPQLNIYDLYSSLRLKLRYRKVLFHINVTIDSSNIPALYKSIETWERVVRFHCSLIILFPPINVACATSINR